MSEKAQFLAQFAPLIGSIVALGVAGWVITTWMRIKHGYPLEGAWGQAIHPAGGPNGAKQIEKLISENAQLRDEIGRVKERLATVERIVTDGGIHTAAQIEALRTPPSKLDRAVAKEKVL
jgi:hypothetical protein